jgi:hypothetical protein
MNSLQYKYDELISEHISYETFDPPIEQLYPESASHFAKLLDAPAEPGLNPLLPDSISPPQVVPEAGHSGASMNATVEEGSLQSNVPSLNEQYPPTNEASIGSLDQSKSGNIKKERIKEKITKAKERFPPKTKLIQKDDTTTKREKQLVRNRLSAQRSRDNKKKELQCLREENNILSDENAELRTQLESANTELTEVHRILESLSPEAKKEYESLKERLLNVKTEESEKWSGRPRRGIKNPIILASLVISCVCIIACLTPVYFSSNSNSAVYVSAGSYAPSRLLVSQNNKYIDAQNSSTQLDELQYF